MTGREGEEEKNESQRFMKAMTDCFASLAKSIFLLSLKMEPKHNVLSETGFCEERSDALPAVTQ